MTEEFKKQLIKRERIEKKHFIEELGDLCCKYNVGDVLTMKYNCDKETGVETVTVYNLAFTGDDEIDVNVTHDSLPAMVRDIFKVI